MRTPAHRNGGRGKMKRIVVPKKERKLKRIRNGRGSEKCRKREFCLQVLNL